MNDVEFASYADDNTQYAIRANTDTIIVALEDIPKQLFQWFRDKQIIRKQIRKQILTSAI